MIEVACDRECHYALKLVLVDNDTVPTFVTLQVDDQLVTGMSYLKDHGACPMPSSRLAQNSQRITPSLMVNQTDRLQYLFLLTYFNPYVRKNCWSNTTKQNLEKYN